MFLSTAWSLFAVTSRHWTSLALLSPIAWYNTQPMPKKQRQKPTSFISMITLAMENATLTGLVSTQPGTFLSRVLVNREATSKRSLVVSFQSETRVWECGPTLVEVSSSSRYVRCQTQRLSVLQLTLTGTQQICITWWRHCWLEGDGRIQIWEAKSWSIKLRWSQYTYLKPSAPHFLPRFLRLDRESQMQRQKPDLNSSRHLI